MTKHLPDYSQWLTPERLRPIEEAWEIAWWEKRQAELVAEVCARFGLRSVVEYGCGSGWVPHYIPIDLDYLGVDANADCLGLAHRKNMGRLFLRADLRTCERTAELVCSFAVLKHFGLHEWSAIAARIIARGRYAVFSMCVGADNFDDGVDYHHVTVTEDALLRAIADAGHELVEYPEGWPKDLTGERMIVTRRREL